MLQRNNSVGSKTAEPVMTVGSQWFTTKAALFINLASCQPTTPLPKQGSLDAALQNDRRSTLSPAPYSDQRTRSLIGTRSSSKEPRS